MQELTRVCEAIENYTRTNEVKLDRKDDTAPDNASQAAPSMTARIQESLRLLESADPGSLYELVVMRNLAYQLLRLLGNGMVDALLSDTLQSLPSLAQKLGKEPAAVRIGDNGYRVRTEARGILQNVFMHLLRNSIGHGIEPVEERIAQGKPVSGTIDIGLSVDQDILQITLCGNGRGLALERICSIAVERDWLDVDQYTTDEDIMQRIFRPGLSTTDKVTEVSRRGVGMDAMQEFLKCEQGRIELRFTDNHKGATLRQFRAVACLLERFAADSVDAMFGVAPAVRVDLDKETS